MSYNPLLSPTLTVDQHIELFGKYFDAHQRRDGVSRFNDELKPYIAQIAKIKAGREQQNALEAGYDSAYEALKAAFGAERPWEEKPDFSTIMGANKQEIVGMIEHGNGYALTIQYNQNSRKIESCKNPELKRCLQELQPSLTEYLDKIELIRLRYKNSIVGERRILFSNAVFA